MSEGAVAGLEQARMLSLERVPVRVRESGVTLSAWRLSVESAAGPGAIVRVEAAGAGHYRGEGVFLGWSQERMAKAYEALQPPPEEPGMELPQLG